MDELDLVSQCIEEIYVPTLSRLERNAADECDEVKRAYMAGARSLASHLMILLMSHRVLLQDDVPSLERLFSEKYEIYVSSKDEELTVESLIEAAKELGVYKE